MERSEVLVEVVHPPTVGLKTPYSPEAKAERDTELAGTRAGMPPRHQLLASPHWLLYVLFGKTAKMYSYTLCHVSLNTGNQ